MMWLYRHLLAPIFLLFYLCVIVPFFNKPRLLFKYRRVQRLKRPEKPKNDGEWIWIHASSGEFEYAKSLIRELKGKRPIYKILITYSSPSYAKQIENFELVDHSEPLPFDTAAPLNDFINYFRPKILLIARTDLWPEMLRQCRLHGIPSVLFALSFPKQISGISKIWKTWILSWVDTIYVITDQDAVYLKRNLKFSGNIEACGDPRFDQALFRINEKSLLHISKDNDIPILLAGSTWPIDESVVIKACLPLLKKNKMCLWIAPHEPTSLHINNLLKSFEENKLKAILLSKLPRSESPQILIIDKLGVLAQLYANADLAFIGGSFRSKVHSVMEALITGCPVFVGPKYTNNREAVDFSKLVILNDIRAVNPVNNAEDFKVKLELMLSSIDQLPSLKKIITDYTKTKLGSSRRILDHLISKENI